MRRTPFPIGSQPTANPAYPGPSPQNRALRATRQKCHKVYIIRYIRNRKPIVMSESSVYTGGYPCPTTSNILTGRISTAGADVSGLAA